MKQPTKIYTTSSASFIFVGFVFILIGSFMTNHTDNVDANKINCSQFHTQADAQKVFDSDEVHYKNLDRDHDQIACEELLKSKNDNNK